MLRRYLTAAVILVATACTILACAKVEDTFFVAALGLDKDRVILASQLATNLTVSAYDLDGNLIKVLADYQGEANGPRGLALFDSLHVLLSLEGDDRLDLVNLGGGYSTYIYSSFLTGTIGKITGNSSLSEYYIIEAANSIERFSSGGQRVPVSGNSFVSGALAPCAAPASLRVLLMNDSGELVALQSGAATGFRYTVGPTVASACTAISGLPTNVNDAIKHSNGYIYWIGTNSQVYRASQTMTGSTSIFNSTATINTPTALAELPNGDLIIASDATDSVEVIGVDGTYRGTFKKDVNTQQVHSILVVPGQ